jgi:hypothetical protein
LWRARWRSSLSLGDCCLSASSASLMRTTRTSESQQLPPPRCGPSPLLAHILRTSPTPNHVPVNGSHGDIGVPHPWFQLRCHNDGVTRTAVQITCCVSPQSARPIAVTMPAAPPRRGRGQAPWSGTGAALGSSARNAGAVPPATASERPRDPRRPTRVHQNELWNIPSIRTASDRIPDARWIFVSRQWSLDTRCAYISSRGWYMFGFGEHH